MAHLRESTPSQPIPQEDRTRYDGYLQAVTSRFPQGSPVRVLMRTLEGKTVLDFKSVPIDEVEELVEALREQLYAMREAAQTEQAAAQMS